MLKSILNQIAGRKLNLFGSVQGCVKYENVPLISKIQGNQKVTLNLMITIQNVTSNVQTSPASL
jgi:hypothetical protein